MVCPPALQKLERTYGKILQVRLSVCAQILRRHILDVLLLSVLGPFALASSLLSAMTFVVSCSLAQSICHAMACHHISFYINAVSEEGNLTDMPRLPSCEGVDSVPLSLFKCGSCRWSMNVSLDQTLAPVKWALR